MEPYEHAAKISRHISRIDNVRELNDRLLLELRRAEEFALKRACKSNCNQCRLGGEVEKITAKVNGILRVVWCHCSIVVGGVRLVQPCDSHSIWEMLEPDESRTGH